MRAAVAIVALVASLALSADTMRAEDTLSYTRDARVEHIGIALSAIDTLGPNGVDALYREVLQGSREVCRADFSEPTISCLLVMAKEHCETKPAAEQAHCMVLSDVIVTNMLSEKEFVSDADRLALMNEGDNFRNAMIAELRLRYAPLVTGLALSPGFNSGEGLAPAIDEFCEVYASTRYMVWQRCVSAVVWYIGTEGAGGAQ